MPPFIDLTGRRFGRLVVVARVGTTSYGQPQWECQCDCGTSTTVFGNALRAGLTHSCGCLHREAISTHGQTGTTEFTIWQMMRQRCENPAVKVFPRYGGRGIAVCARWRKFENFLADMGKRPSSAHTLDRRDNDGGYSPDNCRWATALEQGANKSSAKCLEFNGETLSRSEWSRRLGISHSTIARRLHRGLSIADVLTK